MALGLLIYLVFSMLVGFLGRDRKFGFWGYFFASVLLSPIIGFILVLGSDRARPAWHNRDSEHWSRHDRNT